MSTTQYHARYHGIKVSALPKVAEDLDLWNTAGLGDSREKVVEMCKGTKQSYAQKIGAESDIHGYFISWCWKMGLRAVFTLAAELLSQDDTIFIDILCFPQADPAFSNTLASSTDIWSSIHSECKGLIAVAVLFDEKVLGLPAHELSAIQKVGDAPGDSLQLLPFFRLWCIPELYTMALHKKPITIAIGAPVSDAFGRWRFERVQNAPLLEKIGELASLESASCSDEQDRPIINSLIEKVEAASGKSYDSKDRAARVQRLLQTAVQGAIVANEFPAMQAVACATGGPMSAADARKLAHSVSSLGRSALMAACAAGYLHVVKPLLAAGADASLVDASGKSAMNFASNSIDPRVLEAVLAASPSPVVSPNAPAGAQGKYEIFLSHKQTDAKDFARALHAQFTLRGLPTFLDMEFKEELNDLEAIVASCRNFVFILTDNVLKSEWCLKELASAVRSKCNIILITKEGSRWGADRQATFPPYELIKSLEPAECQKAFTSKSIAHSDEYYQSFLDGVMKRLKSDGGVTVSAAAPPHQHVPPCVESRSGAQAAAPVDLRDEVALLRTELVAELRALRTPSSRRGSRATCVLQ